MGMRLTSMYLVISTSAGSVMMQAGAEDAQYAGL